MVIGSARLLYRRVIRVVILVVSGGCHSDRWILHIRRSTFITSLSRKLL